MPCHHGHFQSMTLQAMQHALYLDAVNPALKKIAGRKRSVKAEYRTSHVTSHVTRHTSHVTRHTSHVTRHTSHGTRHTSHVTRHTSTPTKWPTHLSKATCSSCPSLAPSIFKQTVHEADEEGKQLGDCAAAAAAASSSSSSSKQQQQQAAAAAAALAGLAQSAGKQELPQDADIIFRFSPGLKSSRTATLCFWSLEPRPSSLCER
jgi:hypothetical protein